MKWLGYAVVLLLGILFFLIGLFNSGELVQFDYLLGEHELPLPLVMMLSFVFGALLSLFIFGVKTLFWRSRAHKLQAQIDRERRDAHHELVKSQFEAESAAS